MIQTLTKIIDNLRQAVERNWLCENFSETILPILHMVEKEQTKTYNREGTLLKIAIDRLELALPSKAKLCPLQVDGGDTFKNKVCEAIQRLPFDVRCFVHTCCAVVELNPKRYKGFASPRGKMTVAVAPDLTGFDFIQTLFHEIGHCYLRHRGGADDELEATRLSNSWL